jgi:hypothetical protein
VKICTAATHRRLSRHAQGTERGRGTGRRNYNHGVSSEVWGSFLPNYGLRPSVRVCRDKPARCERVQVSDSEGRANHTGPESCAGFGNGVREALTGERAGRVWSPEIGRVLGADALRTRGRQQRARHYGKAYPHLAGSKTPGMHGNIVCGTREALPHSIGLSGEDPSLPQST